MDSLATVEPELRDFIDEYRAACLWYLREDYYPQSVESALRILNAIARCGDLAAFQRAGRIRACLSPPSSDESAA